MTIHKSIGWAECTWNPATGCTRGCPYCYAREMHHRFEKTWGYDFHPQLHPERLKQPYSWTRPRLVFTCSMGELFELNHDQVKQVLQVCKENPLHRFLILSKRSEDLANFIYPQNVWLGVTVTGPGDVYRVRHLVRETNAAVKYLSIEPLERKILDPDFKGIDWIIIGGRRKIVWPHYLPAFTPPQEWVHPIIDEARRVGAAIFMKENLGWPDPIREWPQQLQEVRI